MLRISVRTPLYPTEDAEKVRDGLLDLFPDLKLVVGENEITGTGSSLSLFAELLRNQRIRDAARSVLLSGLMEDETVFTLNKQTACAGGVSFAVSPVPLGTIEVSITDEDVRELIDVIAPSTAEKTETEENE